MCEQSVVQGGRPLLSLLFKPLALQPPFSLIVDPFFIFFFLHQKSRLPSALKPLDKSLLF